MTDPRNASETRRRGIVLLYTLSVLMIVLSLGFAYTQASFSMARGLGSSAFQQLAYQAALSGQAYGMSYIQQMVDARNHNKLRYPIERNCGAGISGTEGMEWWAGVERCPQVQCSGSEAAASAVKCGGRLPGAPTWFHYSDVIPPGQATERYRLWFRLQMNESLTRNGYFYSDEQTPIFPCGTTPNQADLTTAFPACNLTYPSMMLGPFVPCGRCVATNTNVAPYPHSNFIQYILMIVGVVEATSADTGVFAPVAWSQIDAPFHITVGGYLDGAPGTACRAIVPDLIHTGMYRHITEWEASQMSTRPLTFNLHHAQPYIYLKEPMVEVVRDPPDRPRAFAPSLANARPPAP